MVKKVEFLYIDQARFEAGLLICQACEKLGVSEQTWRRWRALQKGPFWAFNHLRLLSGNLDYLGWKHFQIRGGVLYNRHLNPRYYHWEPTDLMLPALFPGFEAQ